MAMIARTTINLCFIETLLGKIPVRTLKKKVAASAVSVKSVKTDDLVKSLLERHPGESRGPEHLEITGFRLSPE
jgi:hypothetical protein